MNRVALAFDSAIAEAARFMGATAPNPPVGCALLDDEGEILVTAAHHRAGTPHAEARALADAARLGVLHRARCAVVTLEPCNHTGRTPPCSEALRASPVREVWIGAADPHHLAAGGAARLAERPGGMSVHFAAGHPALAAQHESCRALIGPFASRVTRGRCRITVKQALDAQGSMSPPPGRTTFTDSGSLRLAHLLRRATDAIITGAGTVLADNPRFTVRHVPDYRDRAPRLLALCDRRGRVPATWDAEMRSAGFHVLRVRDLADAPASLAAHGANWAMVEGGPALLEAVRAADMWDDWLTLRLPSGRLPSGRLHSGRHHSDLRDLACRSPSPLAALPEAAALLTSVTPTSVTQG
nr:dihydrofolate reductase family protein [Acidomonas methanolica]